MIRIQSSVISVPNIWDEREGGSTFVTILPSSLPGKQSFPASCLFCHIFSDSPFNVKFYVHSLSDEQVNRDHSRYDQIGVIRNCSISFIDHDYDLPLGLHQLSSEYLRS